MSEYSRMEIATTTQKEGQMAASFSPVVAVSASQPGALDGFQSRCECCGLVLKSSLLTALQQDLLSHSVWHAKRGK